jgi:hypothetical protein
MRFRASYDTFWHVPDASGTTVYLSEEGIKAPFEAVSGLCKMLTGP